MSKNNKKLFLILPSLSKGGAEKVMIHLANNLDPSVFSVTTVLLSEKENDYDFIDQNKTRLFGLKSKKAIQSIFKFIRLIRKEKPDIVLSTLTQINMFIRTIKLFLPNPQNLLLVNQVFHLNRYTFGIQNFTNLCILYRKNNAFS